MLAGAGLYCDEHRCCETHSLRTLDSLGPIWEQPHCHYSGSTAYAVHLLWLGECQSRWDSASRR